MFKKLLYILLLLFCCGAVFSQNKAVPENQTKKNWDTTTDTRKTAPVFSKKDTPLDLKVSPEIIYVINDKPVSREEYQKQNKKNNNQK